MAISQNGWSAGTRSELGITTFTVPGSTVRLPLRPGASAMVLLWLAEQFDKTVEDIDVRLGVRWYDIDVRLGVRWYDIPDDWAFAPRNIRGSETTLSNHASGTAMDLNARAHPLGKAGTFKPTQVAQIRRILAHLEGVVRWGGDYSGRKDEMHFEINAGAAAVARVAAKLSHGPVAMDGVQATNPAGDPQLVVDGKLGPNTIKQLQISLNRTGAIPRIAEDGDLGPKTVRALQARLNHLTQKVGGVRIDSELGPKTVKGLQLVLNHLEVTAGRPALKIDGDWGPATTRALQRCLNAGEL